MLRGTLALLLLSAAACAARHPSAGGPDPERTPAAGVPVQTPVLVDEVVAQMAGRVITLSDVDIEIRISRAAVGRVDEAFEPVTRDEEARALPELVDWAAVLRTLRSHYAGTLDPRADEREMARMKALFHDPEKWQRFLDTLGLSEVELMERRRRAIEAQAIVEAKLADMSRLQGDGLDEYLRGHPGLSRDQAISGMAHDNAPANLERLLEEARAGASVRMVGDFGLEGATR